jgi:phosphoribosylformylglycinamidine cyclo-ligase
VAGAVSDSYRAAGVDYDALDAGKRRALGEALATSGLLGARGGRALDDSRGEPAFVFELAGRAWALVVEGLGTKAMIARAVAEQLGVQRFSDVAYDTVAAIVNDLCCVGALPLAVSAYFATGSSRWYADEARHAALLHGWRRACEDAGAVWGGGESPSLRGLVSDGEIELAGSAVGAVPEGHAPLLGSDVAPGDEIVLIAGTGMHANGASLARALAAGLAEGYATPLPGGRLLGEALLDPAPVYVGLVAALLESGVPVHYLSHITGHGLLKLMRPRRDLTYRVSALPEVPEVLAFLVARAGLAPEAAYRTFNMGAGYAVYCTPGAGGDVVATARARGLGALVAGRVEAGPRRVILEPVGVTYEGEALRLGL